MVRYKVLRWVMMGSWCRAGTRQVGRRKEDTYVRFSRKKRIKAAPAKSPLRLSISTYYILVSHFEFKKFIHISQTVVEKQKNMNYEKPSCVCLTRYYDSALKALSYLILLHLITKKVFISNTIYLLFNNVPNSNSENH